MGIQRLDISTMRGWWSQHLYYQGYLEPSQGDGATNQTGWRVMPVAVTRSGVCPGSNTHTTHTASLAIKEICPSTAQAISYTRLTSKCVSWVIRWEVGEIW